MHVHRVARIARLALPQALVYVVVLGRMVDGRADVLHDFIPVKVAVFPDHLDLWQEDHQQNSDVAEADEGRLDDGERRVIALAKEQQRERQHQELNLRVNGGEDPLPLSENRRNISNAIAHEDADAEAKNVIAEQRTQEVKSKVRTTLTLLPSACCVLVRDLVPFLCALRAVLEWMRRKCPSEQDCQFAGCHDAHHPCRVPAELATRLLRSSCPKLERTLD
mmetsp:Transcript_3004/g.9357  ORF Transcript_3004/g.9357 Transcript_3004/m.9357 type:complete len:221 (+) Transcript_3004:625-1287(+)